MQPRETKGLHIKKHRQTVCIACLLLKKPRTTWNKLHVVPACSKDVMRKHANRLFGVLSSSDLSPRPSKKRHIEGQKHATKLWRVFGIKMSQYLSAFLCGDLSPFRLKPPMYDIGNCVAVSCFYIPDFLLSHCHRPLGSALISGK